MADPIHHAQSSANKWGGHPTDYLHIHQWFDETKAHFADNRHRAMRHHSEGIGLATHIFGPRLILSTGKIIPTRWVAEQHVKEDLGFIPTMADWLRCMKHEAWMTGGAQKLSRTVEL